jgi:2-polyprenyl-3-methyl-5-hydroxy-6-metoxy-1,4-benzoquinol methylase
VGLSAAVHHDLRDPVPVHDDELDSLLAEQVAYYRARADEYDETGVVGAEREGRELQAALDAFRPHGRVLELACGTGQWTGRLAASAQSVTAVDASPEVLAINRRKVGDARVRYVEADLFDWRPADRYDTVFFAFWLSHVPPDRFDAFWALVAECLTPGGRVFFIEDHSTLAAQERTPPDQPAYVVERDLLDGRTYRAVKVFREPQWLIRRLSALGWEIGIESVGPHFFYGTGQRSLGRRARGR